MSRMRYAIAAAVLLAATGLGVVAHAQQAAPPPFATTKVDGTDNVYIFRNGGHQAMFVVTTAGVIATDPVGYGRPTGGQTYLGEIRKVTNQPVKYVIYSHHHFDHIAGGSGRSVPQQAGRPELHHVPAGCLRRGESRAGPATRRDCPSSCAATAGSGAAGPEPWLTS